MGADSREGAGVMKLKAGRREMIERRILRLRQRLEEKAAAGQAANRLHFDRAEKAALEWALSEIEAAKNLRAFLHETSTMCLDGPMGGRCGHCRPCLTAKLLTETKAIAP